MIWHIFKKDWKLLRWLVAGVAIINALYRLNRSTLGLFDDYSALSNQSYLFGQIALLATGALIVIVAQQDAIPGLSQDWLVRPVRRTDLLVTKIAFVVLLIQFPIFVMEVIQGLAAGFPLAQSLAAPLSRSLWMLLAMDLPLLAFATLTRNLTEAAAASVAVVLAVSLFTTATVRMDSIQFPRRTDFAWIVDSAQTIWGLLSATLILLLQYYRRKTIPTRWISGGAVAVWLFLQLLPGQVAFAVGEELSPQPSAANSVQITLGSPPAPLPPEVRSRRPVGFDDFFRPGHRTGYVRVFLPLNVSGSGDGKMLRIDHLDARLGEPGGKVIEGIELPQQSETLEGGQIFWIRQDAYDKVGSQAVRLELEYSLSLLRAMPAQPVPAVNGDRWIGDVGHCATRVHHIEGTIEVGCLVIGNPPCLTFFLQNLHTGTPGWESKSCGPHYEPWFGRVQGDSMTRIGRDLHYRDHSPNPRHPDSETQIQDADMMIRVYKPEAHFERRLVLPQFKMSEWAAE